MGTLGFVNVAHTCLADCQVVAGIQSLAAFHDKPAAGLVDIVGRKASTADSCLVDIGLKNEKKKIIQKSISAMFITFCVLIILTAFRCCEHFFMNWELELCSFHFYFICS